MKKEFKGNIMLLFAALIWGSAFVAQSAGMDYIGPFTMQTCRFILSGVVLLPVLAIQGKYGPRTVQPVTKKQKNYQLLAGCVCGCILFTASALQQCGLLYTTVGKSGFITALYIVLVPVIGLFLGRRVRPLVWAGVGLSVVGLYLLCMTSGLSVNRGDLLTLGCALFNAFHILYIDHVSNRVDGVRLSCTQFFVCAAIATVFMFVFEKPTWSSILQAWLPICYAGILSGGVAFTLQILGQKYTKPTNASLIMSLESVFAVLAGWILLHQRLSAREILGCLVMFAAILLAQLPGQKAKIE